MRRPNFLLICLDQLAEKAVGTRGATPTIDALARDGVSFPEAYANCPLCQPSRASLWTGRLPHETNVRSNGGLIPAPLIPDEMPTLGSLMSGAGYRCHHFGKRHDSGGLRGFDLAEGGQADVGGPAAFAYDGDTFRDEYATRQAVEFLESGPPSPFCAVVDLNNPHNICGFVGANDLEKVRRGDYGELPSLPANFQDDDVESRPLPVQYVCCAHRRQTMAAYWTDEQFRAYLAAYDHFVRVADAMVGRILAALHATPAGENTVVVLYSDHGDAMTAHRLVTKHTTFYEETTHVPFFVSGPKVPRRGRASGEPLTSLLDLLPTVCDLADVGVPADLLGRSLVPWLFDAGEHQGHSLVVSEWHTEWETTVEPGRMLRTRDFKYTLYREGDGEELYDMRRDRGETQNLASLGEFAADLEIHRALMREHLEATGDDIMQLEPKVDPKWRSHPPGFRNHRGTGAWEELGWW